MDINEMSESDRLRQLVGEELATCLEAHFANNDRAVSAAGSGWAEAGYTRARLVAVDVRKKSNNRGTPETWIAKIFPRGTRSEDVAGHRRALESRPQTFVNKHIVEIPYDPVTCDDTGEVIAFQDFAGDRHGFESLAKLNRTELTKAFRTITNALLDRWNADHHHDVATSWPKLLYLALGAAFSHNGWLFEWAEGLGLTDPEAAWVEFDGGHILPNPVALALGNIPVQLRAFPYLIGNTHGDLHRENVLIPKQRGDTYKIENFALIDLVTFDEFGLLSNDPAMLLMSLLCDLEYGDEVRRVLLDCLVKDEPMPSIIVPPWLKALVDAFFAIGHKSFASKNFDTSWHEQLKTSLAAAALCHAAYDTLPKQARLWSFRLAAELAGNLASASSAPPTDHALSVARLFSGAAVPAVEPHREFLNHERKRVKLRAAVMSPQQHVIVVHGKPGVGKSKLVDFVLTELVGTQKLGAERIRRLEVVPATRLTAHVLAAELEDLVTDKPHLPDYTSSLDRLETAVESLGQEHVVLVIESAERLFEDHTSPTLNVDLNDAIELLIKLGSHRVKLLLVTRELPAEDEGRQWLDKADKIEVCGLPLVYFQWFLDGLKTQAFRGLPDLPQAEQKTLHGLLGGNPRLAEITNAMVTWIGVGATADSIIGELKQIPPGQIPGHVLKLLIGGLDTDAKTVLRALDAFAFPVTAGLVAKLLADHLPAETAQRWLGRLLEWRVIRRTGDRYYLPERELGKLLWHEPEEDEARDRLAHEAANNLSNLCKRKEDVRALADLEVYFAELNARLRAKRYVSAHGLVIRMDELLRRWGCEGLLLAQREMLRDVIGDEDDKMENHNALGHLYSSFGLFDEAARSYDEAIRLQEATGDAVNRRRTICNQANLFWARNHTALAADGYRTALDMAERDDDSLTTMTALEGLANCHRRWGEYDDAIRYANKALGVAGQLNSPQQVIIALKLARWHDDLDDFAHTHKLLDAADELLDATDDRARKWEDLPLRAEFLDARADVMLGRQADSDVVKVARQAVRIARDQDDLQLLQRARTTLCLAYVWSNDPEKAAREITAVNRSRRRGGSLLALALHAIVARRDPATASGGGTASPRELFHELHRAATGQRARDQRNVSALHMEGLAVCGLSLDGVRPLEEAVQAFLTARDQVKDRTPVVNRRLTRMVEFLGHDERHRLQPVLEALAPTLNR